MVRHINNSKENLEKAVENLALLWLLIFGVLELTEAEYGK